MVERELIAQKQEAFLSSFSYPVSTNVLAKEIFEQIGKLFDGMNPVFQYEFSSQRDNEDWNKYRNNELKVMDWWKTEAFEAMQTRINSFLIVDLPAAQQTEKPTPYIYLVDVENVQHVETLDGTQCEWIMFKPTYNTIAFYDDEYYRVFRSEDGNLDGVEPEIEVPHSLGYCPARTFWTDSVNTDQRLIKRHLFTNWLYKLNRALFYDISNEVLNTYSRFQVSWSFNTECNFEDQERGHHCKNGHLATRAGVYVFQGSKPAVCPVCSEKRFNGAGSHISVDQPNMVNDKADLRNPFGFADIPIDSLEYNNKDVTDRCMAIYSATTGFKGLPVNNQAVNEKQVVAIFESLETALKGPQRNIELAIQWSDDTMCRLRYDTFNSSTVSLGTEHFLMDSSTLIDLYETARKSAFSADTLDLLQDKYFSTEYRNNPELKARHMVVMHLDPFRHHTNVEVTSLYNAGKIKFGDFMMKVNLSSLLMRFESEVFPINAFHDDVPLTNKVKVIKEHLLKYIEEMRPGPIEEPIEAGAQSFN